MFKCIYNHVIITWVKIQNISTTQKPTCAPSDLIFFPRSNFSSDFYDCSGLDLFFKFM